MILSYVSIFFVVFFSSPSCPCPDGQIKLTALDPSKLVRKRVDIAPKTAAGAAAAVTAASPAARSAAKGTALVAVGGFAMTGVAPSTMRTLLGQVQKRIDQPDDFVLAAMEAELTAMRTAWMTLHAPRDVIKRAGVLKTWHSQLASFTRQIIELLGKIQRLSAKYDALKVFNRVELQQLMAARKMQLEGAQDKARALTALSQARSRAAAAKMEAAAARDAMLARAEEQAAVGSKRRNTGASAARFVADAADEESDFEVSASLGPSQFESQGWDF